MGCQDFKTSRHLHQKAFSQSEPTPDIGNCLRLACSENYFFLASFVRARGVGLESKGSQLMICALGFCGTSHMIYILASNVRTQKQKPMVWVIICFITLLQLWFVPHAKFSTIGFGKLFVGWLLFFGIFFFKLERCCRFLEFVQLSLV